MNKKWGRGLTLASVTLGLAACAHAPRTVEPSREAEAPRSPAEPTETLGDERFAAHVPEGFELAIPTMGVALVRAPRTTQRSSIIVSEGGPSASPEDPDACRQAGEDAIDALRASDGIEPQYVRYAVVELPAGPACQYELALQGEGWDHAVVRTELRSGSARRVVTCTLDRDDPHARKGCATLLETWQWLPEPTAAPQVADVR